MAYAHSWNGITTPVPTEGLAIIREVLSEAYREGIVQYELENPDPPVVTPQVIRFNGVGENGRNTFLFKVYGQSLQFCATGRKPYDEVVMKVLIALKHVLGAQLHVTSDGDIDVEWRTACKYMAERYNIDSFSLG